MESTESKSNLPNNGSFFFPFLFLYVVIIGLRILSQNTFRGVRYVRCRDVQHTIMPTQGLSNFFFLLDLFHLNLFRRSSGGSSGG